MKSICVLLLLAAALAGCSSPPKPAMCTGDFRPINKPDLSTSADAGDSVVDARKVNHVE
jgi:PBP1b-binding outer membrane lipoprotein LpoB